MIPTLYEYQEKLLGKEKLQREMEQSLPLSDLKRLKAEFEVEKAGYLQSQKNSTELKRELHLKDGEKAMLIERIATIEEKMYSGTITNGRELSAMEEKGKNLRLEQERAENEISRIQEGLEKEREELVKRSTAIKQRQQQFGEVKDSISSMRTEYEEKIAVFTEELEALAEKISETDMEWFLVERDRFQGKPLALVTDGNICTGCHRRNPQLSVEKAVVDYRAVRCDFCGRFLCG